MKNRSIVLGISLFCLIVGQFSFGQSADTATIVGVVSDPTGAVIPGATLQLTHVNTGSVYNTDSNAEGYYRSPPVRIGEYLIEVESAGFKRTARRGVTLNVGDVRQVDITLEIGVESHGQLYRNPFIDPLEPHELKADIATPKEA